MVTKDDHKQKDSTCKIVWQRAGTGRAKELHGTGPPAHAVGVPAPAGRPLRPSEANRPVALRTHSYTYVFGRLSHHTHRTQLQRTFCEGLHGAPPAEPNTAFYGELDERLRLQHSTLAAVHTKSVEASLAAAGAGLGAPDTVALRHAMNSSLAQQMDFFTRCMASYCLEGPAGVCTCPPGCECACRAAHTALRAAAWGHRG